MAQRDYLEALLSDYESSLSLLVETDFSCRQLVGAIHEYENYIDERVLWIRSVPPVGADFIARIAKASIAIVSHPQTMPLLAYLSADVRGHGGLYLAVVVAISCMLALGWRSAAIIARWRSTAQRYFESGIPQTLAATGLILLVAAAWPSAVWFFSWRLALSELSLGEALARGLQLAAAIVWFANSIRWLCRREGVAQIFWQWPEATVQSLRSYARLYLMAGVPLTCLSATLQQLDEGSSAETLGRLVFVGFCLLVAVLLAKALHPAGTVIGHLIRSANYSPWYKLRWLWYPAILVTPLVVAALALMGYLFTAEQLMLRLELTIGLIILLAIAYTMLKQWLLAARRRLAVKQARDRREAERLAAGEATPSSPIPPVEQPQLDLILINKQVLRFVQVTVAIAFFSGCWLIWDQVFPAVQVFGRVELWSSVVSASELVEADGGHEVREVSRIQSVTRADLAFALAVLVIAILASRNLPGLMELSILPKLPLDHGVRNAIKILSGYAFLVTASSSPAIRSVCGGTASSGWWPLSPSAWALVCGIFANFVSGLIILFERPVRIGDIVTIDGVSGTFRGSAAGPRPLLTGIARSSSFPTRSSSPVGC